MWQSIGRNQLLFRCVFRPCYHVELCNGIMTRDCHVYIRAFKIHGIWPQASTYINSLHAEVNYTFQFSNAEKLPAISVLILKAEVNRLYASPWNDASYAVDAYTRHSYS